MAVSKRTRYEVLRRDNSTCRYCGKKAPEQELHVDHVMPVSLGGSDKPDNLVAACVDCNAGKASASPDAELVADVAEDALRWIRAMKLAGERAREVTPLERVALDAFADMWGLDEPFGPRWYAPPTWRSTILDFMRAGGDAYATIDASAVALDADHVPRDKRFVYFRGILRNKLGEQAEAARQLIEAGEV